MGNYAEFWIGPLYIGKTKGEADSQLLELFRDSERAEVQGGKRDLPFKERLWFNYVEDSESITAFFYHAPVPIVRDRLELKGYTLATAKSALSLCIEAQALKYPEWRKHFHPLVTATTDEWLTALRWIKENSPSCETTVAEPKAPARELVSCMRGLDWFGFPGPDLSVPLRLAIELCPDSDEFVCDLTDLLLAEYACTDENIISTIQKTILITEGRSDSHILSESLKLLYPHLADCFTFMDFEEGRIAGGAGGLANMIKAFSAAGITNKILGIFDNDTAAEAALRALRNIRLPSNIKTMRLPELESLRAYPTIGLDGHGRKRHRRKH